MAIQFLQLSSLEKVFPDRCTSGVPCRALSLLGGETGYYQVAFRSDCDTTLTVSCQAPAGISVSVRRIGFVPSTLPVVPGRYDDDYLTVEPGLFPDPLFPFDGKLTLTAGEYTSLWVTVLPEEGTPAGTYPVCLTAQGEGFRARIYMTVYLHAAPLAPARLKFTQWFHADCIADYYGTEVRSEEWWNRVGAFLRTAADCGINLIYTPVVTPPLDTAVGGERTTVQLVDITLTGDVWEFDFRPLGRWISLCRECGITEFEICHLFTQWGAVAAPKIMVTENGEYKRKFGWDTPAAGEEYPAFLSHFLPALVAYLKSVDAFDHCRFHISDEPHGVEQLDGYLHAKSLVAPYVEGRPVMDALSSIAYYESGAVEIPVTAINHIEPFLKVHPHERWGYYCVSQNQEVSNRFMAMPLRRDRVLGMLLFKYRFDGFLQWGFNFYNTQYSRAHINPFLVTDAGGAFPSGDPFSVYPGPDGPLESIRSCVFRQALQDLRAYDALAAKIGHEETVRLIEREANQSLTFRSYPRSEETLLRVRRAVDRALDA